MVNAPCSVDASAPRRPASPAAGLAPFRTFDGAALAQALRSTRARTLALMDAWEAALPTLEVPYRTTLNPPRWEWGHIAWFQTVWIGRNLQRDQGRRADPAARTAICHPSLPDAWFDSSVVPHATRWHLSLPSAHALRVALADTLEHTLQALDTAVAEGRDLYFWHWVLAHEDMHAEASLYMAQALGLPWTGEAATASLPDAAPRRLLQCPAATVTLGAVPEGVFSFDNERQAHSVAVAAYAIDDRPVSWDDYLVFVEATGHPPPQCLRKVRGHWEVRCFDQWLPLDGTRPASYLSAADAQAWCLWAGRRLPTEAEWEAAARADSGFRWGTVWEWTASPFEPYPGFTPDPYRDYSAPWFHTHRVLRGASEFTAAHRRCPVYRNFFVPERTDIPAGFRTVAQNTPKA